MVKLVMMEQTTVTMDSVTLNVQTSVNVAVTVSFSREKERSVTMVKITGLMVTVNLTALVTVHIVETVM